VERLIFKEIIAMLGSIAQDCKGRERYIEVLAGCRKENGTICVLIKNSNREKYRVTLFPNGTSACRHEVKGRHEACPARGRCYHIRAVMLIASLFTDEGYLSKEQAPKVMQDYYHDDEVETAATAGDKSYEEALTAVYEQLGATKKVSTQQRLSARGLMRGQRTTYCGGQRIA
jgi:hypothetical protein